MNILAYLFKKKQSAAEKLSVVEACRDYLDIKIRGKYDSVDQLKKKADALEQDILKYNDAGDETKVDYLTDEYTEIMDQIELAGYISGVFVSTKRILNKFYIELSVCVNDFGWDKYVTNEIEVDNLNTMLLSDKEEDMLRIMDMVQEIMEKIESKIQSSLRNDEKFKKMMDSIKKRTEILNKKDDTKNKEDRQKLIDDLKKKHGKVQDNADADLPSPTPADKRNQNSNANKA